MCTCRLWAVVCVALLCAGQWFSSAAVCGQSLSAATGPQQMIPSGAPAVYPSTYPSTQPSTYPVVPATYPAITPSSVPSETGPAFDASYAAPPSNPSSGLPTGTTGAKGAADAGAKASSSGETMLFGGDSSGYLGSAAYAPYGSGETRPNAGPLDLEASVDRVLSCDVPWTWQVAPEGLLYPTYMAGREPRIASVLTHERTLGWMWNAALGGRVGLLRYGTEGNYPYEGWQLDVEGAAFPRLDIEREVDLVSCDFRGGLVSTTRRGVWESKFGYYHLSAHLGDEYMVAYPSATRINYVRESLLLGLAFYLNPNLRLYSEAGWAFHDDGGAKPWELQFGIDFCSTEPTGFRGSPFFAINAHLREENDYGGNMTVQTGWQWRGQSGRKIRLGMHYFNGKSDQCQFYNQSEEQIGGGVWYDF